MQNNIPNNYLQTLQGLLDNNLPDIVADRIKKWGLKIEVKDGKLVDISNTTEVWLRKFITVNSQMLAMKDKIRKAAEIDDELLISGATGTGKEIIAHALHGNREGRFVAANCAGLPENLIEAQFFGHMKGSFTGAIDTRPGLMRVADKGTLFLDEVAELPLSVQGKFLRAIQERKVMPVGGDRDFDITCRIVCATHRNLREMVSKEQFRTDLYARISTLEVHILPLNNRLEDTKQIIDSIDGGKEFMHAYKYDLSRLDLSLNVRSLQQHVKRFKIWGELPTSQP